MKTRSEALILKRLQEEVGLSAPTSKRVAKKLQALAGSVEWATPLATRKKLPNERRSITHKFSVGGHEGYVTVSMYPDGSPGEVFVKMAKEGSTLSGVMDALAVSVSIALQYGVPLRVLVDKFRNSHFEPSGYTQNPEIRYAKSIVDYIGRWLGGKFISHDYFDHDSEPVNEPAGSKQQRMRRKKTRNRQRKRKKVGTKPGRRS